jgi:hypothetical protein
MGMLSDIFHKIFPASHPAVAQVDNTVAATDTAATDTNATAETPAVADTPIQAIPEVDVEKILDGMGQSDLNWRSSIVDLLKLLGLDSSLEARHRLATELHFTGDTNDSATMNEWLHKEVMNKLAQNGGKVPDDLKG